MDKYIGFDIDSKKTVGMMCGIAENRVPGWRATVAVCQNSRKKQVFDGVCLTFLVFSLRRAC